MFEGFEVQDVDTWRGDVHQRVGGTGPPLLPLHGALQVDSGHYLAKERPEEVLPALRTFFMRGVAALALHGVQPPG
jgi:hypothetical protein